MKFYSKLKIKHKSYSQTQQKVPTGHSCWYEGCLITFGQSVIHSPAPFAHLFGTNSSTDLDFPQQTSDGMSHEAIGGKIA